MEKIKNGSLKFSAPVTGANRYANQSRLLLESSQAFHQAALTTRSIILVDDAFFRGLIEGADSSQHSSFGLIGGTGFQSGARRADSDSGRPAINAVAQAALFILLIAFDLRLDVCQGLSPEKIFPVTVRLV